MQECTTKQVAARILASIRVTMPVYHEFEELTDVECGALGAYIESKGPHPTGPPRFSKVSRPP